MGECTSDTEMVSTSRTSTRATSPCSLAPLPRHYLDADPDRRPGQRRRLPGRGGRRTCRSSGAFKFESVTPQQELRLARNENYTSFATGKPAHLDTLIFKWYGDADLMIAGFKAGEIDVATDLQDSDLPKVQDLGEQVSRDPRADLRVPPPELVRRRRSTRRRRRGGCSRNPTVLDRGKGCPMADPAMREAVAYAVDKNEINSRLLGGTVQVANTNVTPGRVVLRGPAPGDVRPGEGAADPRGGRLGRRATATASARRTASKAKIELCTTTRQVRMDTLALGRDWLKDVGIEAVVNAVDATAIFADYNESTVDTPCVLSVSNFDLAEHALHARRSTRSATTSTTTEPVRARWRERRPGRRHAGSTRRSTRSRTASTSPSSRTRWPSSSRSTSRRPSRSRCTTASR